MNQLTIGDVALKTGLPTKTIRFYESIGLINAPLRAENKYRIYPPEVIDELILIKEARDLGLPITEIRKLMVGCEGGRCTHNQSYLLNEIDVYRQKIEDQIKQLIELSERLKMLQKTVETGQCYDSGHQYCCNLLKQLTTLPKEVKPND